MYVLYQPLASIMALFCSALTCWLEMTFYMMLLLMFWCVLNMSYVEGDVVTDVLYNILVLL